MAYDRKDALTLRARRRPTSDYISSHSQHAVVLCQKNKNKGVLAYLISSLQNTSRLGKRRMPALHTMGTFNIRSWGKCFKRGRSAFGG